jgi:hypothetical protein
MVRLVLVFCCALSLFFAGAVGQPGGIGLFSDAAATSCTAYDELSGLVSIYVVHVQTPGATACQFSIPEPWCSGLTYLSEAVTSPYIKIGTCSGPSATGCAIAYGSCRPSPNMVLTLTYFGQGTTVNCCCMYVEPDPTATPPGIYVTDCADPPNLLTATGGVVKFNPDGSCTGWYCDEGCINSPVPVEETTWGSIKAMFAD